MSSTDEHTRTHRVVLYPDYLLCPALPRLSTMYCEPCAVCPLCHFSQECLLVATSVTLYCLLSSLFCLLSAVCQELCCARGVQSTRPTEQTHLQKVIEYTCTQAGQYKQLRMSVEIYSLP